MYSSMIDRILDVMQFRLSLQVGKTYATAELARRIGATVLCESHTEAQRVRETHNVPTAWILSDLRGTSGPYVADPDALVRCIRVLFEEFSDERRKLAELKSKMEAISDIVES